VEEEWVVAAWEAVALAGLVAAEEWAVVPVGIGNYFFSWNISKMNTALRDALRYYYAETDKT
jgi:hypothetical protein